MDNNNNVTFIDIQIIRGKGFPKDKATSNVSAYGLILESSFIGQTITSPLILNKVDPQFSFTFRWAVTPKKLQEHRTQRSSIKVYVYITGGGDSSRKLLGYLVIFLRDLPLVGNGITAKPKFFPLLSPKLPYHPELEIKAKLEDSKTASPVIQHKEKEKEKNKVENTENFPKSTHQISENKDYDLDFEEDSETENVNKLHPHSAVSSVHATPRPPIKIETNLKPNEPIISKTENPQTQHHHPIFTQQPQPQQPDILKKLQQPDLPIKSTVNTNNINNINNNNNNFNNNNINNPNDVQREVNNQVVSIEQQDTDFDNVSRNGVEYQIALELEYWKNRETIRFKNEMVKKEEQLLMVLELEWKKKLENMQQRIKNWETETATTAKQLQDMTERVSTRERVVVEKEEEIQSLRETLQHAYESKLVEVQNICNRMKEGHSTHVQMEQEKCKDLEERNKNLRNTIENCERRMRDIEAEYSNVRKRQDSLTPTIIKQEIDIFTNQIHSLETEISANQHSTVQLKTKLHRAYREIALTKQEIDRHEQEKRDKERSELEILRKKYIQQSTEISPPNSTTQFHTNYYTLPKEQEKAKPQLNEDDAMELGRLMKTRRELLSTGVLTECDASIKELDKHIDALKRNKKGNVN